MKKCDQGFTLIEVMIAMVMVVLVLLGFTGANAVIQRTSEETFQRTVALQDGNQVVEMMRNAAASGTFPANVTTIYANGGTVAGFSNLVNETVTINYVDPLTNPLDVTVTIAWRNYHNRNTNMTLRSRITQRL